MKKLRVFKLIAESAMYDPNNEAEKLALCGLKEISRKVFIQGYPGIHSRIWDGGPKSQTMFEAKIKDILAPNNCRLEAIDYFDSSFEIGDFSISSGVSHLGDTLFEVKKGYGKFIICIQKHTVLFTGEDIDFSIKLFNKKPLEEWVKFYLYKSND